MVPDIYETDYKRQQNAKTLERALARKQWKKTV